MGDGAVLIQQANPDDGKRHIVVLQRDELAQLLAAC
jgi:hypothetical protein